MVTRHTPAVMIDEGPTRQPLETFTVQVVLGSAGPRPTTTLRMSASLITLC